MKELGHGLYLTVSWCMTLCTVTSVGNNFSKDITSVLIFTLMMEALYSTKSFFFFHLRI